MRLKFDIEEIKREISMKDSGTYEIRVLMSDKWNTKLSVYFDSSDPDEAVQQLVNWKYPYDCNINFFMTVNPVKECCKSREQFNKLKKVPIMTTDEDIEKICWLPIDIDSERPKGVCATREEKRVAWETAKEVRDYLKQNAGLDNPEIVDSGNGYHLKYRVSWSNDEEGRKNVETILEHLKTKYPAVDTTSKNPARILKIPGTITMKGRDDPEHGRPFRKARILQEASPAEGEVN